MTYCEESIITCIINPTLIYILLFILALLLLYCGFRLNSKLEFTKLQLSKCKSGLA